MSSMLLQQIELDSFGFVVLKEKLWLMDCVLDPCSLNYPRLKKTRPAVTWGTFLQLVAALQNSELYLGRVKQPAFEAAANEN